MTQAIKREMRRRSAVEPVIGHIKNGHRMDLNYLAGPQGDAINAVLAAAGYNFHLLLNWLRLLLCLIASVVLPRSYTAGRLQIAYNRIVHGGQINELPVFLRGCDDIMLALIIVMD